MSALSTTGPRVHPLLGPSEQTAYRDEPIELSPLAAKGGGGVSNDIDTLPTDDVPFDAPKTRSWSTTAFKSVIVFLMLLFTALFIKGFFDGNDVEFDVGKALKSALGGGLSGAAAMVFQILTLMPLRTVMSYQCRYGTTMSEATRTLYADGGWTRYYQGLPIALVQGPVVRFGDTAANAGILPLLQGNTFVRKLPALIQTAFASMAAACLRILLMPISTIRVTMQTEGKGAIRLLRARVEKYGFGSLWYGASAALAASFVGHYTWFGTYNHFDANLPMPTTLVEKLLRSAFIGFVASLVSDIITNSLRVLRNYCQVNAARIGYLDAARAIIAADGVMGLFGRGLKTRILANGLQGIMFSVLWKLFLEL